MKVRYEIKRGDKVRKKGEMDVEVIDGRRVQFRDPVLVKEGEFVELYFPEEVLGKLDCSSVSSMYPHSHLKAKLGVE